MASKKTMEVSQKIIDMTEVPDEKFAKIAKAFEDWKADGMSCGFGYWEDEDLKEYEALATKLFEKTMIKGVILGGVSVLAGMAVTMIADTIIKTKKDKKVKEEVEEFIDVVESKL